MIDDPASIHRGHVRPTKVAIVGTCPSSRMLAPFDHPDWEIWAIGPDNGRPDLPGMPALPRITRFFDLHGDLGFPGPQNFDESGYISWMNRMSAQGHFLLHAKRRELFQAALPFPRDEVFRAFAAGCFQPFTSSAAWLLGFACLIGVKQVGLFGLDMAARSEYLIQRPMFQAMIWLAESRYGVAVHAPLESDVLSPLPIYGENLSTPRGRKTEVRRQEILGRIQGIDRDLGKLQNDRAFLNGALDDIDYHQSIWAGEIGPAAEVIRADVATDGAKVVNLKGD